MSTKRSFGVARALVAAGFLGFLPFAAQAEQSTPDCRDDPFYISKLEASQLQFGCLAPGGSAAQKPRGAEGPVRQEGMQSGTHEKSDWERLQEWLNYIGSTNTP